MDKKTTCAFTGHRPEKLNMSEKEARHLLCKAIEKAINKGYKSFITGCAMGVDLWAGELVLEFKNIYPHIELICALPFPDFAKNAPHLIKSATIVKVLSDSYSIFSYQQRNMWMVDNSSLIIALYSDRKGGTENTINYAKKAGVEILYAKREPLFRQLTFIKENNKNP